MNSGAAKEHFSSIVFQNMLVLIGREIYLFFYLIHSTNERFYLG